MASSGKRMSSGVSIVVPGAHSSYQGMDSELVTGNSELSRKKRGRPRKYRPDFESSFSSMQQMAASSSSSAGKSFMEMEKKMAAQCGGGVGNERKHKGETGFENLGDWLDCSTGSSFLPHVITINSGEDVCTKIMEFAHQGPRAVCIVSGRGSVMNITLRHPNSSGGIVTYEGLFEIVSLSGSFTPGSKFFSRTGTLAITASGADRRIVGGLIAGRTTAATPIKVVVTSFLLSCPKLRSKKLRHCDYSDSESPPPEWTRKTDSNINISLQ